MGATDVQIQQSLTFYLLPYALMTLWHGAISDSIGRITTIKWGLGVFVLASIGCAFATNIETLWFFRALQGISGGAGFSVFRFDPHANIDGQEVRLQPLGTEGQGLDGSTSKVYHLIQTAKILQLGVYYKISPAVLLELEVSQYFTSTDYLDDVSNRYATYEELRASFPDEASFEMAKYISDPTGQGTYGFQKTASRRGNPDVNDSFTFLSLEASYKITWKKRGIYGQ